MRGRAGAHLRRYEAALPFVVAGDGAAGAAPGGGGEEHGAQEEGALLAFFRERGVDLKLGAAAGGGTKGGGIPRRALGTTAMYS